MLFLARAKTMWRDQTGAVAVYLAILLSVLVASAGVSIDAGRGFLIHTRLSNSLDAAGLAAGATISNSDSQTTLENEVKKYLNANVGTYMDATVTNVVVTPTAKNTVIGISAKATIPTVFMQIFGVKTMTVSSATEITRAVSGLELAMVLDVTGSMAGSIGDLKTASHDLLDILFAATTTGNDKLWVGIVPFSQAVNVGSDKTAWLDLVNYALIQWVGVPWGGCVDARTFNLDPTGEDSTDSPPSVRKFSAYYWPDDDENDWRKNNGSARSGIGSTLGPNRGCPTTPVRPMTNVQADLKSTINSLQASGNTHVNIGAVWGWRMLSPRWRGLWGGTMNANNLPLNYNTDKMIKAVVLMTDGENTLSSDIYSAYGYMSQKQLGTSSTSSGVLQLNSRLEKVCTDMKNNNILVYTVAFNDPGATIEGILERCASTPEYYFDTPTGADLKSAFKAIGDSLSNLRVSK